jgi:hypothetical protein
MDLWKHPGWRGFFKYLHPNAGMDTYLQWKGAYCIFETAVATHEEVLTPTEVEELDQIETFITNRLKAF